MSTPPPPLGFQDPLAIESLTPSSLNTSDHDQIDSGISVNANVNKSSHTTTYVPISSQTKELSRPGSQTADRGGIAPGLSSEMIDLSGIAPLPSSQTKELSWILSRPGSQTADHGRIAPGPSSQTIELPWISSRSGSQTADCSGVAPRPSSSRPSTRCALPNTKLKSADEVMHNNPDLCCAANVSKLACKLAQEAFFGNQVLMCSTVTGKVGAALDQQKMDMLQTVLRTKIFPDMTIDNFRDTIWCQCKNSIAALCKRLRKKQKKLSNLG